MLKLGFERIHNELVPCAFEIAKTGAPIEGPTSSPFIIVTLAPQAGQVTDTGSLTSPFIATVSK